MKRTSQLIFSAVLALTCALASLHADTVTLKSGEKVEGKIISETDADISMQVQISSSITDERTIAKSEIAGIVKLSEDTEAYDTIKNFKTNDDHSYPLASYDEMLTSLGSFIQQYPLSEHLADVKQQQAALETERARVEKGDLKFNGQWLSPDQAAKEKYEIEANQLLQLIKSNTNDANYSGALNAFELLNAKYKGARVFPDAVDYVRSLLPGLQADAKRRLDALIAEQKKFMTDVQYRQEPQKSQLIAAARREQENYNRVLGAANTTWKPYIPRSNNSLQAYVQQLPALITQLSTIPTDSMREANDTIAQADAALKAKDLPGAEKLLAQATKLWPQSDALKQVQASYTAAKAVAVAVAAAKATPTPKPKPAIVATPVPTPTPAPATPFFLSIKGALLILGIVIVIAGIIALLGKSRSKEDEE